MYIHQLLCATKDKTMKNWRYYNHAMIPTTAPSDNADMGELYGKRFWNENRKALLARWTTDWDCGYETNWWYCIKDTPVVLEELGKQPRKDIRKGLVSRQ